MDPFRAHLISLLSLQQAGPSTTPLPTYDGPSDASTDTILQLLGNLTKRLHDAESRNIVFPSILSVHPLPSLGQGDLPRVPLGNNDLRSFTTSPDSTRSPIVVEGGDTQSTSMASQTATFLPISTSPPDLLILPPGPLTTTGFESGVGSLEEMRMLKSQIGDIARVCSAVTRGDLSQKVTTPVRGVVMSQLKDVVNGMVDRLDQFSDEVTRASQGVGLDIGQVPIRSFEGTWRDLARVVAQLATNAQNKATNNHGGDPIKEGNGTAQSQGSSIRRTSSHASLKRGPGGTWQGTPHWTDAD
ncbi:hypothetical protein AB1N83_002757 [Pleurotus pulmonarius]